MQCDDCGLCDCCKRHPRNREAQPVTFETQIREVLEPEVREGALYAEDLTPTTRRRAVSLRLDAQHRDGQLDLDWLWLGGQTTREPPGTGHQRDMQLVAQTASALYDGNDSAGAAIIDEVLERAERWNHLWLDEQIAIIRADTHEEQPSSDKHVCPGCSQKVFGPMPGGFCQRCRQEQQDEARWT